MQAYALARPVVRFSLRVLKAKNDKGNWMYAPKAGGNVEDAAFKVVGKECASQCAWSVFETDHYEVQAFLPRQDAECSKISNFGQFVSIDSRPVSTARGTLKQMMSLFKQRLRACRAGIEAVKDPFIWLNIVCPPDSYDPNVEPAKDDVLFDDSSKVLAAVQTLLEQHYPVTVGRERVGSQQVLTIDKQDEAFQNSEQINRPSKRQCTWRSNMYGTDDIDDEFLNGIRSTTASEDEEDQGLGLRAVNVSNPWIIAKMNAPLRPRRSTSIRNGKFLTPLCERNTSEINSSSPSQIIDLPVHLPWALPTPQPSSSPLRSPVRGAYKEPNDETLDIRRLARARVPSPHSTPPGDEDDTEMHALRSTSSWRHRQKPSLRIEETNTTEGEALIPRRAPKYSGRRSMNDFIAAGQLPLGTPYKPTASSANQPHDLPPEFEPCNTTLRTEMRSPGSYNPRAHRRKPSPHIEEPPITDVKPPQARRAPKYTGWRAINDFIPAGQLPLRTPDQTISSRAATPRNPSPKAPPRPLTQRILATAHTTAKARLTRTRTRSTNLPLERIPNGYAVHNVIATLSTTISALSALSLQLQSLASSAGDVYSLGWGGSSSAAESEEDAGMSALQRPPPTADTVEGWREQIIAFLAERGEGEEGWEEEIDVAGALEGYVAGCL